MSKHEKKTTSDRRISPAIRILALVLSILLAGGGLTYIAIFLMDLL